MHLLFDFRVNMCDFVFGMILCDYDHSVAQKQKCCRPPHRRFAFKIFLGSEMVTVCNFIYVV